MDGNWISVEKSLPTENVVDVLAYDYEKQIKLMTFVEGSFYIEYRKHFYNYTSTVTHWMPLPEPPKTEKT